MAGEATPAQIGGFLVALRLKGETADEIAGFAEAIRGYVADRRRRSGPTSSTPPGTGGDGQATINISTGGGAGGGSGRRRRRETRQPGGLLGVGLRGRPRGARLLARPAAGADRATRSTSSASASCSPRRTTRASGTLRLCARSSATRTVFNVLGPLTNPAGARAQVVGVYEPALVRTIAEVLARLGAQPRVRRPRRVRRSTSSRPPAPTSSARSVDGDGDRADDRPARPTASPAARPRSCAAARPSRTPRSIRAVFAGEERGAKRDAILLNAAGAIAAGVTPTISARGSRSARQAVDSGAAAERLDALVAFSHG